MSVFDAFLEVAGNLGFLVGNNDRRRAQARKNKRSWGSEQDGFALSIAASSLHPTSDDGLRVEVALRNMSPQPKTIQVGAWLRFFSLSIHRPDGSEAQLTSFGKRQIEAAENAPVRTVVLSPGEIMEADLPVGALYDWRQPGIYRVAGKCQLTVALSNELEIRI